MRRPASAPTEEERGQAALEFAVAVGAVMLVVLGVLQCGLWYHAEHVVISAAREGARRAASASSGDAKAGEERALSIVSHGTGRLVERTEAEVVVGPEVVEASVSGVLRGLLPLPALRQFPLRARAVVHRERFP